MVVGYQSIGPFEHYLFILYYSLDYYFPLFVFICRNITEIWRILDEGKTERKPLKHMQKPRFHGRVVREWLCRHFVYHE